MCHHSAMKPRIVVDTSVLTSALMSAHGPNREILRRCLLGRYQPLLGNALFSEYLDVATRDTTLARCPVPKEDVIDLLEAFCAVSEWIAIFYLWRPNLSDEGDNHVLELATAGNARWIVTNNVKDFRNAQLRFPDIAIVTPEQILKGGEPWQP